jgi:hypothetical protein
MERHVYDEGGAVELLRRTEEFTPEAVGDHDVIANFDGIHAIILIQVSNRQ